jgi:hypothetical protein
VKNRIATHSGDRAALSHRLGVMTNTWIRDSNEPQTGQKAHQCGAYVYMCTLNTSPRSTRYASPLGGRSIAQAPSSRIVRLHVW